MMTQRKLTDSELAARLRQRNRDSSERRRERLALAGHTHGGQVVIPFFGPPRTAIRLPRRYAGGLNDYRGTPIHISRGVGMERGFDIPIRFLCPPEIGIIDLVLPKRGRTVSPGHESTVGS